MSNFSDKNWLIAVIFNKWTILIISALLKSDYQKLRPSEIRKGVKGLTQAELSKRIIELERFGIVEKKTFAEVPPRVEYRVTKFGESLRCVIDGIREWVEVHGAKISHLNYSKEKSNGERNTSVSSKILDPKKNTVDQMDLF